MGQQNQDRQSRNPNEEPAEISREEEVRNREDIDREEVDIESDVDDDLDNIEGTE